MGQRKMLGGQRKCGKTTRMVLMSSEKGIPILTCNRNMVKLLECTAKDMGVKIPRPISAKDFALGSSQLNCTSVLVDEIDWVVANLIGADVVVSTTSSEFVKLEQKQFDETISGYEAFKWIEQGGVVMDPWNQDRYKMNDDKKIMRLKNAVGSEWERVSSFGFAAKYVLVKG